MPVLVVVSCGDGGEEGVQRRADLVVVVRAHDFSHVAPSNHGPWGLGRLPFVRDVDLKLRGLTPALAPVVGAIVVVDDTDGRRLDERGTDAEGQVSMALPTSGLSAEDSVTITVYRQGFVLQTLAMSRDRMIYGHGLPEGPQPAAGAFRLTDLTV